MGILRRLVRLPLRLAEAERQIRELQSRVFDISRDLQAAKAEIDVLWRASKSAGTIPCGGCEAPATSRNAHNLPVCDECAADDGPQVGDLVTVRATLTPFRATVAIPPYCRNCGEATDGPTCASCNEVVIEVRPNAGPTVGDIVTLDNIASLPVGTVIKDVGEWTSTKTGEDQWVGQAGILYSDCSVCEPDIPTWIVSLPDAAPPDPTRAPAVGDIVTAENVASLPVGTVVEWERVDGAVHSAVKCAGSGWIHTETGAPMSDGPMVEDPPARIRAIPAQAGPVTAPAPTAKGCHGCRWHDGRTITCWAPRDSATSREIEAWAHVHLADDALTPKPGAPECPARKESL